MKYKWLQTDEALEAAAAGLEGGATRECMVSSGRGPTNEDIDRVTDMVGAIKAVHPDVDADSHDINTAESHHETIVQTHTYADRVDTVGKVKAPGLSPCSGSIAGLGESDEQLLEALFALPEMESDSIPVNSSMPFDGTPYETTWDLEPARCVKILAMARFVCPGREVRIAGGREMHLRSPQGLALHIANSSFLGDCPTSEGQAAEADLELIRDNGFVVLGAAPELREPSVERDPAKRRRGAGTAVAPDA